MRSTDEPHEHATLIRDRSMDRMGGSLINAILGALILWVGQTTFRHAGFLAGVDERFITRQAEDDDVEKRTDDEPQRQRKRGEYLARQAADCPHVVSLAGLAGHPPQRKSRRSNRNTAATSSSVT